MVAITNCSDDLDFWESPTSGKMGLDKLKVDVIKKSTR